ncbi:hypothetical protein D3C81_1117650 [compost metagenome]
MHVRNHADDLHEPGTPKYLNLDRLVLASLAGGGYLNLYDLCSPDGFGLYENTEKNLPEPTNPDVVIRLRNTQHMLNKLAYDLATKQADGAGGTMLKFFNPVSDVEEHPEPKIITKSIRSIEVTYSTADNGVGIAVERSAREIALASTTASIFQFKELGKYKVHSVQQGSYDPVGQWVSSCEADYEIRGEDVLVPIPSYGCVRVFTESEIAEAGVYSYEAVGLPYTITGMAKNEIEDDRACGSHWLKISPFSEGTFNVGNSVTFSVRIPPGPSKYKVVTGYRKWAAGCIAQLSIDGEEYGSPLDMYGSEAAYEEACAEVVSFCTPGEKAFKYTVTGKHAASTNYVLGFDCIKLIPIL